MSKLIAIRHGQSTWNAENRFTGWVDVDLSEKGVQEARRSGKLLKQLDINFDICFTSYLKRAIDTLEIVLKVLGEKYEYTKAWELNERHYGALTGLNKKETEEKIGEEQQKTSITSFRRLFENQQETQRLLTPNDLLTSSCRSTLGRGSSRYTASSIS